MYVRYYSGQARRVDVIKDSLANSDVVDFVVGHDRSSGLYIPKSDEGGRFFC
jgi:hypothetical protein